MAELSSLSKASVYNQVYPLQKPDYSRDVTEASREAFVLVHLRSSIGTNVESRLVTDFWRDLARRFGEIKFCEIQADLCIEGYPERNTPTILIYKDGDIKRQIVTLKELQGERTKIEGESVQSLSSRPTVDPEIDLQKVLVDVGAIKNTDHRISKRESRTSLRNGRTKAICEPDGGNDDDDWD